MRLPLLVSIGLGACSVGEVPLVAPADQPLPAELHEGDLITLGDLALVVPAPDESVGISAHLDDGTTFELTVANEGGQIVATVPPHATIDSLAVAQNACSDGAYTLEGFHWDRELRWSFQAGSTTLGPIAIGPAPRIY